jgi:hypothetical protein
LVERFTTETEVRSDIVVQAQACERAIKVTLIEADYSKGPLDKGRRQYHSTGLRNVSTMRDLAQAILDACDFVDASNPAWSSLPPVEVLP